MLGIRDGGAGLFSIAAQSAPVVIRSKHNAIYSVQHLYYMLLTCKLGFTSIWQVYLGVSKSFKASRERVEDS